MAMTTVVSLISSNSIALIIALAFLISPSSSFNHKYYSSDTFRGLVVEEKARLGSKPPSCHNKCNQCHPCMAVQVPTLPSHHRVEPSSEKKQTLDSSGEGNRYSNYKPLGWKCRCDGNFYNP